MQDDGYERGLNTTHAIRGEMRTLGHLPAVLPLK